MNTDVNFNPVKSETHDNHGGSIQHQHHLRSYHQHHRQSSDWSDAGDFEYVYDKVAHQHEPPGSSSIICNDHIDGLSNYPVCVSTGSLDSSSGLNGAYSALDLNNSNGRSLFHHQLDQQQASVHSRTDNNDHSSHNTRQKQRIDYLSSSSSQSVSPVVMQDQEKAKLERKRERNRQAASLCRARKLEKINQLESKVQVAKNENEELLASISECQAQLTALQRELMQHAKHGCNIPPSFQILS